jgi:hypothetical protein
VPLQQNTPRILQAAFEEVTVGPQQSFCIIFPAQTMGLLALADSSGSWAEDSYLACLLAPQTLLDQVAPRLSDASLVNDDAYFVLFKDGAQQVHKALCSAPETVHDPFDVVFLILLRVVLFNCSTWKPTNEDGKQARRCDAEWCDVQPRAQ